MIRAAFGIVFLWIGTAACFAQAPTEADELAQEQLAASTWSGEIRGFHVSLYLLDEGLAIFKVGDEKPREERWLIVASRFESRVRLSEKVIVTLNADIRGELMAGMAAEGNGTPSPYELRRDRKGNPELLAASPPNRPHPPTPRVDPREFEGTYEMDLPEKIGVRLPLVNYKLACQGGKCIFSVGGKVQATFDKPGFILPHSFAGARSALKYARDHKAEAKEEAPHLAPLLESGASIAACIDLRRSKMEDVTGLVILCKVDRDPWKVPAVLLMGLILSDTCRSTCGYDIIPLLRRQ
jgi:hypothetical protein